MKMDVPVDETSREVGRERIELLLVNFVELTTLIYNSLCVGRNSVLSSEG
jgi:hypothetical protein